MIVLRQIMVWLGGIGLLVATLTEVASVIFRHLGAPIHGTIEIVQAAVLVAGSLALVAATAAWAHPRVHLIIDRVPRSWQPAFDRFAAVLSFLLFALLFLGAAWIAWDEWGGQEQSELLGIPWSVLRAFANIALLAALAVNSVQIARGRRP